jgi:hypothetical protein
MTRALHIVPAPPSQSEPEQPKDVTMLLRAEIMARDWGRVMVEGDRRKPWRTMVWRG